MNVIEAPSIVGLTVKLPDRPVYLLRLQCPHGADARRLRWCLKMLLRRLGLRCLSIEIEVQK
jgi:hypothetical protein